jgi:hypothetical protein
MEPLEAHETPQDYGYEIVEEDNFAVLTALVQKFGERLPGGVMRVKISHKDLVEFDVPETLSVYVDTDGGWNLLVRMRNMEDYRAKMVELRDVLDVAKVQPNG